MTKTHYVLGFMFSEDYKSVALIKKNKPEWQKGRLNGIGGKVEKDESTHLAMVREFKEETGYDQSWWNHFALMSGEDWACDCYTCTGPVDSLKTMEAEEIQIIALDDVPENIIPNLHWLLPMALSGENIHATIDYMV